MTARTKDERFSGLRVTVPARSMTLSAGAQSDIGESDRWRREIDPRGNGGGRSPWGHNGDASARQRDASVSQAAGRQPTLSLLKT